MPHYLFQGRYSIDSMKAMVKNPQDRETAAKAVIESVGGKLHSMFLAFGRDDVVAIYDAPDDKAAAAVSMALGASGAMSGGATTKLLTFAEAKEAMSLAGKAASAYRPPAAG